MTETELKHILKRCQNGETEAFARLYDEFADKLYRFIFFRVGHKEVAEDILADTFIKAWQKISQVNSSEALSGWLYQISRNNIIDYYRVKKESVPLEDVEDFLEDLVNPVDTISLSLDQANLLKFVKELPAEQQAVIKYKFFEDLSNEEVAQILNKSEGAIRVIQHRAVLRLKELTSKQS
jgi:RNA polymerase sigma-70 factor (ECF subfamily)